MIDPQFIGFCLLKAGFETWFKYCFKAINNRPFIMEEAHKGLFQTVQNIIDGTTSRQIISICPRSAKTTVCTWLVVYSLLTNPKANIIYTSYSQELLKQIANEVANIMQHPVFVAMFGDLSLYSQAEETNPVDDFWREYLQSEEKKATYTNRKITTAQGGTVLFSAIGSQITGFGVGIRGKTGFTGIMIIDDADKVSDIRSEKIREKTHVYFSETLLTRLNNPDAPILCVQQRLHVDDLSGFLIDKYNFAVFKVPLLDENGNCNFPSQYTPERIKELQINNYAFQAQYQQEPIMLGGGVFHVDWFGFYKSIDDTVYRRIFITADTASKTKEWNDFTAIGVWGLTQNNRLRLLDLVHAKMEIPELQATFIALWNKWRMGIKSCHCSAIYIEDKASGTQVIQILQRQGGLPIMPVTPKADKLTRALDAVPYVAAHNIELPESDKNPISKKFLDEVTAFSPDGNAIHDDICFARGTKIATLFGYKPVEKVKPGDWIITPVGVRKCTQSKMTGIKETITRRGLEATPNHKVFFNGKFNRLDALTSADSCSNLSLKDLLIWGYKKQLYSMEKNIASWGREDITCLNQIQMWGEKARKDFMWRFGNIIRAKRFPRAMWFTIKTTMSLITTLTTWSVFRVANTLKTIWLKIRPKVFIRPKNGNSTSQTYANWLRLGTKAPKGERGIRNTQKNAQKKAENRANLESVKCAAKNLNVVPIQGNDTVPTNVYMGDIKAAVPVYNITVQNAGCYYANNILVSNCDAFLYAVDAGYNQRGYF